MYLLMRQWVDRYMVLHPGFSIYLEAGGTESGFQALAAGKVDICTASRPIRSVEAKELATRYGSVGMAHMVAKDALAIYVNKTNPVHSFSQEQIQAIFTGQLIRWSELGGSDQTITVVIRPPNSGTHLYFAEHMLEGRDYRAAAQVLPTNQAVVREIAANPTAIGYGGSAFAQDIVACSIDGIEPTEQHIGDSRYPLIRYLYLYTENTPRGAAKEFIDWVMSQEGQIIVKEMGYYPIWQAKE